MAVVSGTSAAFAATEAKRAKAAGSASYLLLAIIAVSLAVPAALATCAQDDGQLFAECYGAGCDGATTLAEAE